MKQLARMVCLALVYLGLAHAARANPPTPPKEDCRTVSVEGAVNHASRFAFPRDRTLSILEAITIAGGHTRNGDLKRVWLIRNNAKGEPVKTVINVDAIMKRHAPNDVLLNDGDRVVVIGRDVDDDGW